MVADDDALQVLEHDGDWSVVRRRDCGADRSAFEGLDVPDQPAE